MTNCVKLMSGDELIVKVDEKVQKEKPNKRGWRDVAKLEAQAEVKKDEKTKKEHEKKTIKKSDGSMDLD